MPVSFAVIVHELCTCGNELGFLQEALERNLKTNPDLIPVQWMKERGLTKMCCILTMTNPPMYTLLGREHLK